MPEPTKDLTQEEIEKLHWSQINVGAFIVRCEETKQFHFVDETDRIDGTPHETYGKCFDALTLYAKSI